MADNTLLAGPSLRRLRKREGVTQAVMAASLGISPSYLNLIERNQRPLSARVLVQVIERYDFDPSALREDETIGGVDGLMRRMSDKRFADLTIDREEVEEFLAAAPQAAAAFARLYDNSHLDSERADHPAGEARRAIERWQNHFADLDHAAEELADELRLSRGDISAALMERLREKHRLTVRILPADVVPGLVHRLDLHARQLQLSEMLGGAARRFQIARQIASLEYRNAIATVVEGATLSSPEARQIFRDHITDYIALALLMPYRRFLRACEQTAYDLSILVRRFTVSFDQLAQRLTTLQRVGERGLPFYCAHFDRAGSMLKFTAGASGAVYPLEGVRRPQWVAYATFERRGALLTQAVSVGGVETAPRDWFNLARTIEDDGVAFYSRRAVVLGVEARFSEQLRQSQGISLGPLNAVSPEGPSLD